MELLKGPEMEEEDDDRSESLSESDGEFMLGKLTEIAGGPGPGSAVPGSKAFACAHTGWDGLAAGVMVAGALFDSSSPRTEALAG